MEVPYGSAFFFKHFFTKYFRTFSKVIGLIGVSPYSKLQGPILNTIILKVTLPSKILKRAMTFATLEVGVFLTVLGIFFIKYSKVLIILKYVGHNCKIVIESVVE